MIIFYYSLINLGLGEIAPINKDEYVMALCSMIISSLVFTNIFSSIASLNAVLQADQVEKQEEIDKMYNVL